jgi:hypothetical protein
MKLLLFFLKRFLFENFRYSVNLINITSLALINILGISRILDIARNNILLLILFIASIKGYVSFTSFNYRVTKRNKTTIIMFGWHNRKKRSFWFSSEISYMVLKRWDDTNREGNSITNVYVTRGP